LFRLCSETFIYERSILEITAPGGDVPPVLKFDIVTSTKNIEGLDLVCDTYMSVCL